MKKKIISSLILLVLLCIGASSCYANSVDSTRTSSGIFQYEVNGGNVTITGFINENDVATVEIPDTIQGMPVTSIKTQAFYNIDSIYSVHIPSSVKSIQKWAFANCQNLISVSFGNRNDEPTNTMDCYIAGYAFTLCDRLEELWICQNISIFSDYDAGNRYTPEILGLDHLKKIRGHKGSWAEKYAKKYNISFKPIINFNDVNYTSWYYKAVKFTFDNGLIKGLDSTHFGPYQKLSRAMLVTIIWRMEGEPQTNSDRFPDVKSSDWYFQAVNWAESNGIVNGYLTGKFGPKDDITREQLAAILMNYARYKGIDLDARGNTDKFIDFDNTGKYFKDAVSWCVANKIISGKENGTKIDPKGNASRAEVAAMIQNYCKAFNSFYGYDI